MELVLRSRVYCTNRLVRYIFQDNRGNLYPVEFRELSSWYNRVHPKLLNCAMQGIRVVSRDANVIRYNLPRNMVINIAPILPKAQNIELIYARTPVNDVLGFPVASGILRSIDMAEVEQYTVDGAYVRTPFGVISHLKLSSGCHTALLLNYLLKTEQSGVFSLASAGGNVHNLCCNLISLYKQAGIEVKIQLFAHDWGKISAGFVFDCCGCRDFDPSSAVLQYWERRRSLE